MSFNNPPSTPASAGGHAATNSHPAKPAGTSTTGKG